jgi:hypothetical protein
MTIPNRPLNMIFLFEFEFEALVVGNATNLLSDKASALQAVAKTAL